METLVTDLKKIVLFSADLVSRAGSLQSPSWKFPDKLAVSLDVGRSLEAGITDDKANSHFFVLELVIDRLLLVLQCCVLELEAANGRRSSNTPLTLGSTVKRLSKCVLQNSSHSLHMKEQLSTKTEQVATLSSSFCDLQRQYDLLRTAVAGTPFDPDGHENSTASGADSLAVISDPTTEVTDACIQTTDTAFALCAQCTETQLALVNSARLISGLCDRNKLGSKFSSYDWDALVKIGRLDVGNWWEALQTDAAALDENTHLLLKSIEELISERDELQESSHKFRNRIQSLEMQLNSLKDLQSRSTMALSKSKQEFAANVSRLESTQSQLKSRNTKMKTELKVSEQRLLDLSATMTELEVSRGQLEVELHTMEGHEWELKTAKQDLEDQLESVMRQSQEALNDRQVELNKSKLYGQTLDKKFKTMKSKQSALLNRLDALDEECTTLKEELVQVESSRERLACDLQQVQTQYSQVQQRLNTEQNKLSESNQEQEKLSIQLTSLQTQLGNAKEEVETEKDNCRLLMDYPFVKQGSEAYSDHVTSLTKRQESRKQITANTIRILLLEEQNNELRHTSAGKARELKEQYLEDDRPKVSHPLPLWEQELVDDIQDQQVFIRNSTRREKIPQQRKLQPHQTMGSRELPVEVCKSATGTRSRASSAQGKPQSAGGYSDVKEHSAVLGHSSMKGRLGHLKRAVADAHRNSSSSSLTGLLGTDTGQKSHNSYQPMDIEVYLCDKCDRMFCHAEKLQRHSLSCEKLAS